MDKQFLKAVSQVIDEPGTDVAVTYLAEVAPGILLAREETDGEVVVYVNLKIYRQSIDWDPENGHFWERNALPGNIGVVQHVLIRSLDDMVKRAKAMVVLKNGKPPKWYGRRIQIR
jgi:hypothetical protein